MAGHSHWAGIKHKKGRADKLRSNLFSKLSREITVAAKLGDKDPGMNSRLRSAIQSAKSANMPKDNIQRAIDKSELNSGSNYENIRYEGFGPHNTAVIVETLTDNKNRTASNLRTIFQKNGGSMVMLAKGNRSKTVVNSCKKYGGFYLGSIGGVAAKVALESIKKVEVIEFAELGMEAIWKINVENFPAFVVIDNKGNDFYDIKKTN